MLAQIDGAEALRELPEQDESMQERVNPRIGEAQTRGALSAGSESFGSTSLVEVRNHFYLNSNSSGSGLELKYGGAALVAGVIRRFAPGPGRCPRGPQKLCVSLR